MPIINSIAADKDEMTRWRRDFHQHPEIAFEEVRTSGIVAEKLESWGIEVHKGIAKTGVVGVIKGRDGGASGKSIGLRADMDALPMQEENDFEHRSTVDGKFHGCGHDGHTTMLLGAAKYLAETRNFDGTVHLIFQPAEEGAGGGKVMVEEGLFDRFPCDEVYGMHNWPDLPAGSVGVRPGPIMAASDLFEAVIEGRGGHAAMPHYSIDPVIIATQIVQAFQPLVARTVDPLDNAVISVTQIHAGSANNVIPENARISGTVRTFKPETRDHLEREMGRLVEMIAEANGGKGTLTYHRGYPATVNHENETEIARHISAKVVGEDRIITDVSPVMGGEDFSFMLNERPGAYLFLGQAGGPSACKVHNPRYDFNDEILPIGASLFSTLVEERLRSA